MSGLTSPSDGLGVRLPLNGILTVLAARWSDNSEQCGIVLTVLGGRWAASLNDASWCNLVLTQLREWAVSESQGMDSIVISFF